MRITLILAIILAILVITAAVFLYLSVKKTNHELIIEAPEKAKVFINRKSNHVQIHVMENEEDLEQLCVPNDDWISVPETPYQIITGMTEEKQIELINEYQQESTSEERKQEILDIFSMAKEKYMYHVAYETLRRHQSGELTPDDENITIQVGNTSEGSDNDAGSENPDGNGDSNNNGDNGDADTNPSSEPPAEKTESEEDDDNGQQMHNEPPHTLPSDISDEDLQIIYEARATAEDDAQVVEFVDEDDFNKPWGQS